MSAPIGGLWVAMATPLTEAGAVDHAAMVRHTSRLFSEGCDGVVLFGTTGEGTSFSASERLAATEALLRAGIGAERIGLGVGFPAITDSIALIRQARSLGLVHALLLPPYFYRDVSASGIEDAFAAIFDGVGDDMLRATLYHIPQVSGVGVPPEVVARLRARYGRMLAGVKDSSADFAQFRAFRAAAPNVAVTIGNEVDIGRALTEGGTGTICGMGNLVPGLVRAMFAGDRAVPAMREAISLITAGPFLPGLKAALAALTNEPGWARVRPPLCPGDLTRGAEVAAALLRLQAGNAG
jgi:4-hydroxy-tetrahydrodipicolinate synthase